ncbi:myb/SANT-like DNA-binding domain-containing protein 2 [Emydura macquarii macquarii]|uniref:myb/SANT-like DNA-binding domain-containing protein 2 n=1 Tax=Emydura macquarii macquarii TaxID=1129001 RepID=UPI00352A4D7A
MLEKGHKRDAQQCHVKIKELRQSYQKAREANSHSGSSPKTCRVYDEVHAILSGDPTTVPPRSINTSARSQSMDNDEDSMDEEAEESRVQESEVSILPESQDIFLIREQSSSTQDSTNDPVEGTSDTSALAPPPRNAAERLSQIRNRGKKTKTDDMFGELMNASETELRAWRLTLSQNMDMESRREMMEHDRSTTQEIL